MQIGFSAPGGGPLASPAALTRLAQEAEAMGFGYATVSDHVVIPTNIHAKYPYTDSGEFPASSRGERQSLPTSCLGAAGDEDQVDSGTHNAFGDASWTPVACASCNGETFLPGVVATDLDTEHGGTDAN